MAEAAVEEIPEAVSTPEPATPVERQMTLNVKDSPGATFAGNIHNNYYNTGSLSPLDGIKARTAEALNEFKNFPFAQTRAAKRALKRIKENYFICIEGNEVSGKSTLGHHLLKKLGKQKYIPIILNSPDQCQWLHPDELYVILIDDIFGKSSFSMEVFDQWNSKLVDIFRWVKTGKVFLILTSQEGFFDKAQGTIGVQGMFEKKNKISLSSDSLRNNEKFEILGKLAQHLRQSRDTQLLTETVLTNQHSWFFNCCKDLLINRKPLTTWPTFFEYPVSIIYQHIQKVSRADPLKLATLFIIMRDGCLTEQSSDHMEKFTPELLRKIGSDISLTETNIRQAASSMGGSLLAFERGKYAFLNDTVRDAVCLTIWDIDPSFSIRWFPQDFLLKHMAMERKDPMEYIQVPREHFHELNTRLQQIFDSKTPSYECFQTEAFGKLYLELQLILNSQAVSLQLVSVLVIASVLYRFPSLLHKCLEVWQKQDPSREKRMLEHLTVQKICEKRAFYSADVLAEAGYRACCPVTCEVCSSTDRSCVDLAPCLQLSVDGNAMDNDSISNILKWVVHSRSLDTLSDFSKCIESLKQFEVYTAGMLVACEAGDHEMFENFRCMAGGIIANFDDLVESVVKGGDMIILSYLVQEFKRVRLTSLTFQQACALNKVEIAKMIWEDVPGIKETYGGQDFQESVLQNVVTIVDTDTEELFRWLLLKGYHVHKSTVLHSACQSGNSKAVALLLKNHTNINALNEKGNSALHVLCMSENLNFDVFEKLLDNGADVNIRNKENRTPLHLLCANPHPIRSLILKLLLQRMSVENLNDADVDGNSPLYILLDSGFTLEEIELLLESQADVSRRNGQGETPLHAACRGQNCKVVEMLVEYKVDIHARDTNGFTCLHFAVTVPSNHETIAYLLKQSNPDSLLQPNNSGNTPLHLVMRTADNDNAVTVLLNHGANVLAQNKDVETPFHIACSISNEDSYRFIKSHKEHFSRAMKMKDSPLHLACRSNGELAIRIVLQLLEWGADIDGVDEEGQTPLHAVCETGTHTSLDIAKELCAREANVEIQDLNGNTPLLLACQSQGNARIGVILLLINQGASPLMPNNDGECPMVLMFREGAYDLVRLMIDSVIHKACQSEDAKNLHDLEVALSLHIDWRQIFDSGRPLLLRVCGEHGIGTSGVVDLVLKAGFEVGVTDYAGMTAAHAACQNVGPHTVSVLKVLQAQGCSMSLLDLCARTTLHFAVDNDDDAVVDVLDFLLNSDLEVNSVDADGNTPLHIVCGSKKISLRKSIHWLLNHDANIALKNHNGETCYDVAKKQDLPYIKETLINEFLMKNCQPLLTDETIVRGILELGADINCTDFEGNTIIHKLVLMAGNIDVRREIKLAKSLGGDLRIKNNDDKTAYEIALHGGAEECLLQVLYAGEIPKEKCVTASGVSSAASVEKTQKSSGKKREEIIDDVANFLKGFLNLFDTKKE